jgi:hypothetical protein
MKHHASSELLVDINGESLEILVFKPDEGKLQKKRGYDAIGNREGISF